MTISSQTRKAGPYVGTGSTGPFSFSFKVFEASDLLVVKVNNSTSIETTLTLTTDYTVSLNADQNSNPGGTITLVAALASGYNMVISSQVEYLQETDLTNQGGFYPEVITDTLDKLTILTQQLKGEVDRSAKLPITSTADADSLVADIVRIADSADNLDTVAANIDDVNTVAGDIADVTTVATNIADVNTTADNIAAVVTVANDLNEPTSEIDVVATNIADVNTVGTNIADVNTVADDIANVNAVAANETNIDAVAGNATNINAVAGNATNINAVAGNATNINAVNANKSNIDAVAGNATNINAVAGNATNINAVNANKTNIDAVAGNATNINAVNANKTNIDTCATNIAAIIDAPNQANSAAASAAAAAASAASGMYSAVQDKSANYTVVAADAGDLIRVDTTSGAITITLPEIGSTGIGDGFKIAITKWSGDTNAVTIQRSGTDTINGGTSYPVNSQYSVATFVADLETEQWFAVAGGVGATNIVIDTFDGNASTVAFTLSGAPGTKNNTQVFISGVYQAKDTYGISGTTLTFTAAPPAGTGNIEVVWTQPLAVGVPSDGTIGAAKIDVGSGDGTGAMAMPAGTTAQRPSAPVYGETRVNSTLGKPEWFNGTSWAPMGGGATGGGADAVFVENDIVVTTSYSITSGKNAMSAGPIQINDGVTVTIPDGSVWTIV